MNTCKKKCLKTNTNQKYKLIQKKQTITVDNLACI